MSLTRTFDVGIPNWDPSNPVVVFGGARPV